MQHNFTEFEQAVDKAARDGFSNSHLWVADHAEVRGTGHYREIAAELGLSAPQFMKCVYEVYWANYFNTDTEVNEHE